MLIMVVGLIILLIGTLGAKPGTNIHRYKTLIVLGGIIILLIGFLTAAVRQINPGHIGVQILFGKVQENVIYEGLSVVNPLIDIKELSIQTQNYTMSAVTEEGRKVGDDAVRVLSKDGLEVVIDLTILYSMTATAAPKIVKEIGLDFEDKIVRSFTRTRIRESAADFNAVELYSEKRKAFEERIRSSVDQDFVTRGFHLENLLVRNINLPKSVKESIERKITADQEAQRMKYVLEKEQQEAERKRVEATGITDAQKIMSSGLNDKILQYETIKVQRELVSSPNAKIIIMGGGKGSQPFIIGN